MGEESLESDDILFNLPGRASIHTYIHSCNYDVNYTISRPLPMSSGWSLGTVSLDFFGAFTPARQACMYLIVARLGSYGVAHLVDTVLIT